MAEETILLSEYCARNVKVRRKFAPAFLKTFGIPLDKRWWDNLLGFDVVKFDDDIVKSGDGAAMYDTVVEKYGQDAADLLRDIIRSEGTVITEPEGE